MKRSIILYEKYCKKQRLRTALYLSVEVVSSMVVESYGEYTYQMGIEGGIGIWFAMNNGEIDGLPSWKVLVRESL